RPPTRQRPGPGPWAAPLARLAPRGAPNSGMTRPPLFFPPPPHAGLARRNGAVERAEQVAEPAAERALVYVGVPAVEGERAEPRPVRPRQEFPGGPGGFREIGADQRQAGLLVVLLVGQGGGPAA